MWALTLHGSSPSSSVSMAVTIPIRQKHQFLCLYHNYAYAGIVDIQVDWSLLWYHDTFVCGMPLPPPPQPHQLSGVQLCILPANCLSVLAVSCTLHLSCYVPSTHLCTHGRCRKVAHALCGITLPDNLRCMLK